MAKEGKEGKEGKANKPKKIPAWFPKVGDKEQRVTVYRATMLAFTSAKHVYGTNGAEALTLDEKVPKELTENYAACALYFLLNPTSTIQQFHVEWITQKRRDGWRFGDHHDPEHKISPTLNEWNEIGDGMQRFLYVFAAVVRGLATYGFIVAKED